MSDPIAPARGCAFGLVLAADGAPMSRLIRAPFEASDPPRWGEL